MRISEIASKDVIKAVHDIANERPEHVYTSAESHMRDHICRYADGDEPSCLIGHALHRLGVPVETLQKFDSINLQAGEVVLFLRDIFEGWLDNANSSSVEIDYLEYLQAWQDAGDPWAVAVEKAQRCFDEIHY